MLDTLKNIIYPNALLAIETEAINDGSLKIKETAEDSAISSLKVVGLPALSLAFTLDYQPKENEKNKLGFQQLSCYFNKSAEFINKGCDAVIVAVFDDQLYVLILDIKSKRPNITDTKKQLDNSEVFVKYIFELINTHYPDKNTHKPIKPTYQKSFVTTRIKKNGTTAGKEENNPYREVSLKPNKGKEARVNLKKLLGI